MKNTTRRTLIKAVIVILVLTVSFFGVKKIVTNYVERNDASVGGNNPQQTTEPQSEENDDEDEQEKLAELGAEEYLRQYAEENDIPFDEYPDFIIEMLDKTPAAIEFAVNYPVNKDKTYKINMSEYENESGMPLFIQWDKRWGYIEYGSSVAGITACGPVSLSMVAYYLTGDKNMSPDKIIQFAKDNGYCVPGSGTSWTLISEGAGKLGLTATELPLNENHVKSHLQNGEPIICVMGPGDFTTLGHYIVLTSYEDGYVTVNDSNSVERTNKKWKFSEIQDQIRNLWAISK